MSGPGRRGSFAIAIAAAWAVAGARATPVAADIPALSREFRTERYVNTRHEIEAVLAQRRLTLALTGGAFLRGEPGSANAFAHTKSIGGGTFEAALQLGAVAIGANGITDTKREVEADELARRVYVSGYFPQARLSLWVAGGVNPNDTFCFEETAEVLATRWTAVQSGLDLRPRMWLWLRVRQPIEISSGHHVAAPSEASARDADDRTILIPAAALAIQHVPVLGSQLYTLVSAHSDLAADHLPISSLMVQSGFASQSVQIGGHAADPDAPDARVAPVYWSWSVTMGWAFPLDDRESGRFVAQLGLRALLPLDR